MVYTQCVFGYNKTKTFWEYLPLEQCEKYILSYHQANLEMALYQSLCLTDDLDK